VIKRRVAKDGSVSFQVYSRVTGAKKYVGTFASDREAKEGLQDHEAKQRAIKRGDLPPEVDDKRTLAKAAADWLDSLDRRGSRSAKIHRDRFRRYITPRLGLLPVDRIRARDVMALRDELVPRVAPLTVNSAVMTLSAAFQHFVKMQWVAANPCRGVEIVEAKPRTYVWLKTSEEITRLIDASAAEVRDLFAAAFGTGMRLDELLCLRADDIDVPARLIRVHRGRKGPTKGGKLRWVPILDSVLPLFRRLALRRQRGELVFPGRDGRLRAQGSVRESFKLALRKAGLDTALRVHDARHTFASHWVMNGGDIWRLSKVLGHGSVTVTERFYAHLRPEAFAEDYGRVRFVAPGALPAPVVALNGLSA